MESSLFLFVLVFNVNMTQYLIIYVTAQMCRRTEETEPYAINLDEEDLRWRGSQ